MNNLGSNFMINNGLKEMAANAVELVVDCATGLLGKYGRYRDNIA